MPASGRRQPVTARVPRLQTRRGADWTPGTRTSLSQYGFHALPFLFMHLFLGKLAQVSWLSFNVDWMDCRPDVPRSKPRNTALRALRTGDCVPPPLFH